MVSSVGMDDSKGRIDPPVGGAFRHLTVAGDAVELSEPIHFPHQIAPHDALALSGVFQVAILHDTGLPLFGLYCSAISEQKMKQMISELQSHLVRTVDLAPIGVQRVKVQVPEMFMQDKLLDRHDARTVVKPQFGVVSPGALIAVLGYCQEHGLAPPVARVPTSTHLLWSSPIGSPWPTSLTIRLTPCGFCSVAKLANIGLQPSAAIATASRRG